MNKLQAFTKRLAEAGLSQRQIDAAVAALNEYNNARIAVQTKEAHDA